MAENKNLTLGSLFDGSGGFPLGGLLSGITPVWASEIEPFPIRVTTKRLPNMKHLGDISKINGAEIEPVDIITFGSPCTDLSVAGRRAGLQAERSGLFFQAIRIIKEMRGATNDQYPRYICWENVLGAFSSNAGEDFRCVLEEICKIKDGGFSVPRPSGKWPKAGEIVGDGFSVAYRSFDAAGWGVPQRRKRIYLVADFAGWSAGKILFESEGVSGYSAEGFRAWQRTAGSVEAGSGTASGRYVLNDQGGIRMEVSVDVTSTLRAESHGHPPCVLDSSKAVPEVIALEAHPTDSRIGIANDDICQTLTSRMGTGGGNVPLLMEKAKCYGICSDKSNAMLSDNAHSGIYEANTSRTIDANGGNPGCNQGGIAVVESYAIQGSMIGRKEKNGPQGAGINKDVSFTLNTVDRHAVFAMNTGKFTDVKGNISPTLTARDFKSPNIVSYGIGRDTFNQGRNAKFSPTFDKELQPTLVAKSPGAIQRGYTVRRLTPTECARLQGFPDWWCAGLEAEAPTDEDIAFWTEVWETHRQVTESSTKPKSRNAIVKWLKNPYSDAAEYKMWGNGVALPCVYYVLSGIVYYSQFPDFLL